MPRLMRSLARASFVLTLAIALWPAGPSAQGPQAAGGPAVDAAASSTAPGARRVLTLADYAGWKRVTNAAISDDGKWVTYTYAPNEGDETLFVKQVDSDKLYTVSIGSAAGAGRAGGAGGGRGGAGGGAAVQFSDNGRWVGYFVNPPARAGRGRGAAGGRGAPARGGAPPATPPAATPPAGGERGTGAPGAAGQGAGNAPAPGAANAAPAEVRRFELLDLESGTKYAVPNASGFQFAKG